MIDPRTAVDNPIDSATPTDDPNSACTLLEVMMKNSVLLDDRFEILKILGNGANGQVAKCSDGSGQLVAVKAIKLENPKEYRWRQTEIAILKELRYSDPYDEFHIVRLKDDFIFQDHLCIVTELLGMTLWDLIKAHWSKGFSFGDVQIFAIQIFESLKFLGDRGILHCDFKPPNILLVGSGLTRIKIIDFGSSRYETDNNILGEDSTLQTRWYRAPEILLGMPYDNSIDMWSAGCILAELFMCGHLFPGQDDGDQLVRIMEVLGLPAKSYIEGSPRKHLFFDENCNPICNADIVGEEREWGNKSIYDVLNCEEEDRSFVSIIWHCLQMDPGLRITPKQALHHRFMTQDFSNEE